MNTKTMSSNIHESNKSIAWILCLMTAVFYAFQYVLRLLPNVLKDDLMLKYAIDAGDFGNYNSFYYLGYALFHLPAGVMLDRLPPKYVIAFSVFLCGIGIIPPLYSDSWTIAVIGRFLLGAGSTTAILGVFYAIRLNFPPHRFASILGIVVTLGFASATLSTRPIGILIENIGWENVLYIFFGSSLILTVLFLLLMPNQKESLQKNEVTVFSDLREILCHKHVWAVSLLSGLMIGPLEGFADAWGVPFFNTVYGIEIATSQILPSMIFLGFCFGGPILGYLGEKYKKPYSVMVYTSLIMGLIYVGMLTFTITNVPLLYALMITVGFLCAYQVFMIFINTRVVKPHLAGLSSSFTNMIVMSFGSFFHSIIGWGMVKNWDGQTLNGVPVYTNDAYIYGLSIIPVALLVAFIGFLYIKPKDESTLLNETV